MFGAYAQQITNMRNPFGGFGVDRDKKSGFGLSNFGNKVKEMGTNMLNKFVSNKIEKLETENKTLLERLNTMEMKMKKITQLVGISV